jgi:hypothetical protein
VNKLLLAVAALGLAGCASVIGRDSIERDVENTVRDNERSVIEARTLSGLARLESSVSDYIKHEGKIPAKLDALIPKYLGELPMVELGVQGHRDTTDVKVFSADVLRDGVLNGTRLTDTGRWGYVFNERQVVLFVDCTHQSTRGRPWYLERGVY